MKGRRLEFPSGGYNPNVYSLEVNTMRRKKLGNTGLLVSQLCPGTMTFGHSAGIFAQIGQLQQSDVDGIVPAAFDGGINFIDTADVYHAGQSEVMTGQALRNLGVPRDQPEGFCTAGAARERARRAERA
jgi:predicted oxidoreductase